MYSKIAINSMQTGANSQHQNCCMLFYQVIRTIVYPVGIGNDKFGICFRINPVSQFNIPLLQISVDPHGCVVSLFHPVLNNVIPFHACKISPVTVTRTQNVFIHIIQRMTHCLVHVCCICLQRRKRIHIELHTIVFKS